jgi:hypothetical protein
LGVAGTAKPVPTASARLLHSRLTGGVARPTATLRRRSRLAKTLPCGALLRRRVIRPSGRILRRWRITLGGCIAIRELAPCTGLRGLLPRNRALPHSALSRSRSRRRRDAGRLEGTLLLRERNLFRRPRFLARKEPSVGGGARRGRDGPIREAQAGGAGRNRHAPLSHPCVADLGAGKMRDRLEAAALEIRATDAVDAIHHRGISV